MSPVRGQVGTGVLQIHATRRCNLTCAHCYTSSSPRQREELPADLVASAIADAAELGFGTVSLSGGEPLLYSGLGQIVDAAREVGSRVNVVSNGTLLSSRRHAELANSFDLVALSLDGTKRRHDKIRRSNRSYDDVVTVAGRLRQRGRPFGIIHTLTAESLDDLEEIASLAAALGASLLQLHPLEQSGRAEAVTGMTPLSPVQHLDAYILTAAIAEDHPSMRFQLDLLHREVARRLPLALGLGPEPAACFPRVLVLQEDARVVPLTYGIDPRWTVADLRGERLADGWSSFVTNRWPTLHRQLQAACSAVARGLYGEVVDWNTLVRCYAKTG